MGHEEKQKQSLSPELLARAAAGEREAMTVLYEQTAQAVYRSIHAMVRDEDLTLDIQQDVYLLAFSRLSQLRDPERLLPWLRRIAVNTTRSRLRSRKQIPFSDLEPEGGTLPELPDPDPSGSPELALEQKENARLVREILDGLSDDQRLVIGMYYYEQIPVARIAAQLGLSQSVVRTRLFRGRKRIEAAVRRLEKQGVKLYGLGPLPFLLALLRQAEPTPAAGSRVLTALLAKPLAGPGGTVAAGAAKAGALHSGAAALETVMLRAGRPFLQSAAGRLLLGMLAAAAVGGGAWGLYKWNRARAPVGDYRPTIQSRLAATSTPTELPSLPQTEAPAPESSQTEPSQTEPARTEPPQTEPPQTEPPQTEPRQTEPPQTEPPQTESPASDPAAPETESPLPPATEGPQATAPDAPSEEMPQPSAEQQPESTEEAQEGGMLPTEPPYPPAPEQTEIALGQTWTYSYRNSSPANLVFFAVHETELPFYSGQTGIRIGYQMDGNTGLSFLPEKEGPYQIYYQSYIGGSPSGNLYLWTTLNVTGGENG